MSCAKVSAHGVTPSWNIVRENDLCLTEILQTGSTQRKGPTDLLVSAEMQSTGEWGIFKILLKVEFYYYIAMFVSVSLNSIHFFFI